MNTNKKRIAIMVGAGFVPGMNAVIKGAALAASQLGWETVGIRDGFEGLLHPDRYPEGGLVDLSPSPPTTGIKASILSAFSRASNSSD